MEEDHPLGEVRSLIIMEDFRVEVVEASSLYKAHSYLSCKWEMDPQDLQDPRDLPTIMEMDHQMGMGSRQMDHQEEDLPDHQDHPEEVHQVGDHPRGMIGETWTHGGIPLTAGSL